MEGRVRSIEEIKRDEAMDETGNVAFKVDNYPWAVAGITLTLMLAEVIGIGGITPQLQERFRTLKNPSWPLLADPDKFNEIYGIVFQFLEQEWRDQGHPYMPFETATVATEMSLRVSLKKGPKTLENLAELMGLLISDEEFMF